MKEIRALTGIRGVAAMIVFLAHTRDTLATRGLDVAVSEPLRRLLFDGGRQVDIFFVLSGFIMALTYRQWFSQRMDFSAYRQFLLRRFARIYPLHVVMLLAVLAMVMVARHAGFHTNNDIERFDVTTLPQHFLLVHAWGPFMVGDGQWNPPSWSISIEALAYLIFPVFFWLTYRVSERWPWLAVAAIMVCGLVCSAYIPWGLHGAPAVVRGLSEFALGCLLIHLMNTPMTSWLRSSVGSLVALILLVTVFLSMEKSNFVAGMATAPLLLALTADNPAARAFSCRPAYFLGEISYSLYLGHFLLSSIAYRIIHPEWMRSGSVQFTIGAVAIIVFVLSLSTVSYYLIERPGRRLLRGKKRTDGLTGGATPMVAEGAASESR